MPVNQGQHLEMLALRHLLVKLEHGNNLHKKPPYRHDYLQRSFKSPHENWRYNAHEPEKCD